MPIYEYECPQCGVFEVTQRITEKPLSRCPTCKKKVRKLISMSSFQLKGTGWYVTDYGNRSSGGARSNGGSAGGSARKSNGNGEKKSETADKKKTESKKEPAPA